MNPAIWGALTYTNKFVGSRKANSGNMVALFYFKQIERIWLNEEGWGQSVVAFFGAGYYL